MTNRNRFTLDYTTWSVTADGTTIGHDGPVAKLTMADLQALVDDSATHGGNLDLAGKSFAPSLAEAQAAPSGSSLSVKNSSGSSLTVNDGIINGGLGISFTGLGAVKESDLSSLGAISWVTLSGNTKLFDGDAPEPPFLAAWPTPPVGMKYAAQTANSNWIEVIKANQTNTPGIVHCNVPDWASVTSSTLTGPDNTSDTWPWTSGTGAEGDPIVTYSGVVTGFQILDTADKAAFEAVYNAATDPASWTMMYLSANNIVAETSFTYDSGTGTVTFAEDGLIYAGYVTFAITGDESLVTEDGQYVVDLSQSKLFYQPYAESTLTDVSYPIPFQTWEDLTGSTNSTTFNRTEWYCGGGGYMYQCAGPTNSASSMNNCIFHTSTGSFIGASDTKIDVADCKFDNIVYRAISASEGSQIVRNQFRNTAKSSAVLIQGFTTAQNGDPVAHTLIEDNFFNIPAANHGQGCSLYQGAWMNATVRHNLFLDCQRAFSHQAFGPNSGAIRAGGVFKFENNLVLHNYAPDIVPSGQATVSFNSSPYPPGVPYTQTQSVRNNTILHNQEDSGLSTQSNSYRLDYYPSRYAETKYITNNLCGDWTTTKEDVGLGYVATNTVGNIITVGGPYATSDTVNNTVLTPGGADQPSYFDWANLNQIGGAATGASDGGKVGHRWANSFTLAVANNLPDNWYTLYPAETIPEPNGFPTWGGI